MIYIQFPKISAEVSHTEYGLVYTLYVNEEYEGTYMSKTDLEFRIGLIHTTKINEVLGQ